MALPLWGQLEKSADDNETIEEAIDRIVAEHNADTEAHLGSGESLEAHKTEDIIDHPAGSVLSDKQTMTEISISTIFESLDSWSVGGEVDNTDLPGLQFYVESGFVDESYISSQPQNPKNFRDDSFDMLFQIQAHFDLGASGYNANFGFFSDNSTTPTGFGFVVIDGALYGYVKNGSGSDITSEISLTLTDDHVYRVFLDSVQSKVYFFVDGSQVGVLDVPSGGWLDDGGPNIWVDRGSVSDGNLFVGILNFSRAL